jgi:hypothetical protein
MDQNWFKVGFILGEDEPKKVRGWMGFGELK